VVRLLGPRADWDSVKGSLESVYAGDQYVRADSFPLTPELFMQLDKNKDGKLVKAEYPALSDVPPHLVVAVNLGQPAREGEAPAEPGEPTAEADNKPPEPPLAPRIRLVSIVPHLADAQASLAEQPGRITLRVGGIPITFYLNDTVAGGDFEAQARQALMGLDADKNGYLEEKEVPAGAAGQLGQFAAVDGDENGKVYPDEISEFLKQQQAGLRAQIHLLAADRDDDLFSALDVDHDQRLDAREIEAIPELLALLDAGGDGKVTADEISVSLAVGLARGNLENLEGLFTPPPVIARAPAEGTPRWFTSMDGNGDGAISKREFLGPAEKFASLDTSGDGLVDAAEAKIVAPAVVPVVAQPGSGN
jgi:Ca2+-binding EF-hand superfamily protein